MISFHAMTTLAQNEACDESAVATQTLFTLDSNLLIFVLLFVAAVGKRAKWKILVLWITAKR